MLAPKATLRALVVPQGPDEGAEVAKPAEREANRARHRPVWLSWTRRLKRVFELDLEHCPNCRGALKIIAARDQLRAVHSEQGQSGPVVGVNRG